MNPLKILILPLLIGAFVQAPAQEKLESRDTTALPNLEIPEITIVGKKAITLPWARKGEIYDVTLYEAPPPDTSLLGDHRSIVLPRGALSRYEEHQMPWRASLEGSFGSFSTGGLKAYADYKTQQWGFYGNGAYRTTQGHTDNSSGTTTALDLGAHSLLSTDNDLLRGLRVSGGIGFRHDSYGMFGIPAGSPRRTRSNESFEAAIGSVNRQGNVLDLSLDTKVWNVTDVKTGSDSDVSVVSPDLRGSFRTDIQDVSLSAGISYNGSSLNYHRTVNSPSVLGVSAGAGWKFAEQWFIRAGVIYQNGSGSNGSSTTLVAPTAILQWEASQDREWIFWFQPELHLSTYDEHIRDNPYLVREFDLQPEKRPVRLGTSLSYRDEDVSLRLSGSFTHSTDKDITLSDSGRITLAYVDADQFVAEASGTVTPTSATRIKFSGTLQPGHETGTSVQLPMVPIIKALGRGEIDPIGSLTVWSSVEYWSRRNVDRDGNKTLGDVFLMGCGVSTRAIPRTVISFEIANLFNTGYEWWSGYSAPGRQLTLDAKINLR
jgi:hypothetical protein